MAMWQTPNPKATTMNTNECTANTVEMATLLVATLSGVTSPIAKVEYFDRAIVTLETGAYIEVIDGEPYLVHAPDEDGEPAELDTPEQVAIHLQEQML